MGEGGACVCSTGQARSPGDVVALRSPGMCQRDGGTSGQVCEYAMVEPHSSHTVKQYGSSGIIGGHRLWVKPDV
ncbi:hypothetical protein Tco_1449971 [Tanacetum coccineum]